MWTASRYRPDAFARAVPQATDEIGQGEIGQGEIGQSEMGKDAMGQGGMELLIAHTWDGTPLAPTDRATVSVERVAAGLEVRVASPYFADPAPPAPRGHTDALWEHEVVELFLCGAHERYLELELGPHGHYWIGTFAAPRQREQCGMEITYTAELSGDGMWRGRAVVPADLIPPPILAGGPATCNAYAIHRAPAQAPGAQGGRASASGAHRRHHAAYPVPGAAPDFHRPDCFGPLRIGGSGGSSGSVGSSG